MLGDAGSEVSTTTPRRESLGHVALRAQQRRFALVVNGVAATGFVAACVQVAHHTVTRLDVALLVTMYSVTLIGISAGYHRHFAHRAFETGPAVRAALAIAGAMAGQGPVTYWVALHRKHHQHSDAAGDPHSPCGFGDSRWATARGLAHAHLGWVVHGEVVNTAVFAKDLLRDPWISRISGLSLVWLSLGTIAPALVGGIATWSLIGAWHGFVWGGLARLFLALQATSSVNSICHVFGRRSFDTRDASGNVLALALPTFGESWHNNHHAFPRSARFGLRRWQIDLGALFVAALGRVGLAWDIQQPDAESVGRRTAPSSSIPPRPLWRTER